jgi:hypothetical protein
MISGSEMTEFFKGVGCMLVVAFVLSLIIGIAVGLLIVKVL